MFWFLLFKPNLYSSWWNPIFCLLVQNHYFWLLNLVRWAMGLATLWIANPFTILNISVIIHNPCTYYGFYLTNSIAIHGLSNYLKGWKGGQKHRTSRRPQEPTNHNKWWFVGRKHPRIAQDIFFYRMIIYNHHPFRLIASRGAFQNVDCNFAPGIWPQGSC